MRRRPVLNIYVVSTTVVYRFLASRIARVTGRIHERPPTNRIGRSSELDGGDRLFVYVSDEKRTRKQKKTKNKEFVTIVPKYCPAHVLIYIPYSVWTSGFWANALAQ